MYPSARRNVKDSRMPPLPPPLDGIPDLYDPRVEAIRAVARATNWSIAQGHYRWTHDPAEIIQRSWERYQQPDDLIRKRQVYEVQLSRARKGTTYRITKEITRDGVRYFIWPLPPGIRVPKAFLSEDEALKHFASRPEYRRAPVENLPSKPYTRKELAHWLPPEWVFEGRTGVLTSPGQKELIRSRR